MLLTLSLGLGHAAPVSSSTTSSPPVTPLADGIAVAAPASSTGGGMIPSPLLIAGLLQEEPSSDGQSPGAAGENDGVTRPEDVNRSSVGLAPAFRSIPAYRQANRIAVIEIHGPVDGVTTRAIERRIEEAEQIGADAIVFEIDTFGGQGAAALEICQMIKSSPIPLTVAWVNPKAYSAG
ncbi:MAG: hypothetical protein ACOC0P_07065, partial [Planctomycetota bacterium]